MPNRSNTPAAAGLDAVSSRVSPAPINAGTAQAAAAAVALGDAPARAVFIQSPADAQQTVYVGDADAQPVELPPGAAITVPCSDLSQVYVRADSAQTVAFIAQLQNS